MYEIGSKYFYELIDNERKKWNTQNFQFLQSILRRYTASVGFNLIKISFNLSNSFCRKLKIHQTKPKNL